MTTKKAIDLKPGDKIKYGPVIATIAKIVDVSENYGSPSLKLYDILEDGEITKLGVVSSDREYEVIESESDRLTDDELSPVAKREIGLIDRLLTPVTIEPNIPADTAYIEGCGSACIHYDEDGSAIAVDVPNGANIDDVNYRIENVIDRHIDPVTATRYTVDRTIYALKEAEESSYTPDFDPELVDRLISSRFGFDRACQ